MNYNEINPDIFRDFCDSHDSCVACERPFGFRTVDHCYGCVWDNPNKEYVARLMGYEVVEDDWCEKCVRSNETIVSSTFCCLCSNREDGEPPTNYEPEKEANMDKQKPRICEVLGVEENEIFEYQGRPGQYRIHDGHREYRKKKGAWVSCADEVGFTHMLNHPDRIIRPSRFTEEEVADARAIVRIMHPSWDCVRRNPGGLFLTTITSGVLPIQGELFPSILPGQSVKLSEIVGGAR